MSAWEWKPVAVHYDQMTGFYPYTLIYDNLEEQFEEIVMQTIEVLIIYY